MCDSTYRSKLRQAEARDAEQATDPSACRCDCKLVDRLHQLESQPAPQTHHAAAKPAQEIERRAG